MGKSNKKKTTQGGLQRGFQNNTGFYNFDDHIDYDIEYHLKSQNRGSKRLQKRVRKIWEE